MRRDGGRDIGEGDLAQTARPRTRHGDRHPLARVVGAGPCRIVAVIGGKDRQIAGPQRRKEARHLPVEPFQRAGIARDVAAVAVERVEFHEVRKGQGTVFRIPRRRHQMFEKDSIRPLPHIVDPAHGEDVADLADAMYLAPGRVDPVAKRR